MGSLGNQAQNGIQFEDDDENVSQITRTGVAGRSISADGWWWRRALTRKAHRQERSPERDARVTGQPHHDPGGGVMSAEAVFLPGANQACGSTPLARHQRCWYAVEFRLQ